MKIVEVKWVDAQSSMELLTVDEAKKSLKPQNTKSVGYLVEDNDEYIILVFVNFNNGYYKHWQLIPKQLIKNIKIVEKK